MASSVGPDTKFFCVSFQRVGTSSVGDFFESYGLVRRGWQVSDKARWSEAWYDGDFEKIFRDEAFVSGQIFEDGPWWYPDFYKYVYHRVPGARFVMLTRDSDGWFRSMLRHSSGRALGQTEIHAKIYRREADWYWLRNNVPGVRRRQAMHLYDKAEHYKRVFELYTQEVQDFFARVNPQALITLELKDDAKWTKLADALGLPAPKGNFHAHQSRGRFVYDDIK